MSKTQSLKRQFTARIFLSRFPEFSNNWQVAVREGNHKDVKRMIEQKHVSPDFATTTTTGEHPLKTLALCDQGPARYDDQTKTAALLIRKKCQLGVPDFLKMIPADYALLSGNRDLAALVVTETIIHHHTSGRSESYHPEFGGYFGVTVDEVLRQRRIDNLMVNQAHIGDIVRRAVTTDEFPRLRDALDKYQIDLWSTPIQAFTQDELIVPSLALHHAWLGRMREVDHVMMPLEQPQDGKSTDRGKIRAQMDEATRVDAYETYFYTLLGAAILKHDAPRPLEGLPNMPISLHTSPPGPN